MKHLRQRAIDDLLGILDNSLFTRHAFETKFNDSETGEVVQITFTNEPGYRFVVSEENEQQWSIYESPGDTFYTEQSQINNFSQVRQRLGTWINRIFEEYASKSSERDDLFQELRENLERKAQEIEHPEKPFTDDEAEQWRGTLDSLINKVEKLNEENRVQQQELNNLQKQVTELKKQATVIPRGVWIKSAGYKIIDIFEKIANSEAGRELAKGAVQALTGGNDGST